jgi:ADP-ribose pyrophosphatase YjhB (NUDIX family)
MTHDQFCSRCGARLLPGPGGGAPKCTGCGRIAYLDPKLAAAAIVPLDGGIVLVRRAIEPAYGRWSFPSGYVNRGEKVESAAEREVLEETGLRISVKWLVGLYSTPGNHVVLSVYHAEVTGGALSARDEALEIGAFALDRLPQLAFEHDARIIQDWLKTRERRP